MSNTEKQHTQAAYFPGPGISNRVQLGEGQRHDDAQVYVIVWTDAHMTFNLRCGAIDMTTTLSAGQAQALRDALDRALDARLALERGMSEAA